MSDLLQSGHHPDADQLSAFAEHALPAHEYEQTLAHIAICPDCRRVVALSMPPVAEAQELQPEVVRKHWFFGWRFALPVAAAIAAVAIFVIQIRNSATMRHGAVTTQEAESRSLSADLHPETSPAPASKTLVAPSSNTKPNVPPSQPAGPSHLNGSIRGTSRTAPVPSNRSEAVKASTLHGPVTASGQPSDSINGGAAGGISTANSAPKPGNPLPAGTLHGNLFKADSAATPAAAPVSPAPMGGLIAAPLAQAHVMSAPPAPDASGSMLNYSRGVPPQTPLPSKLPAISAVSVAHQMLAIDSQNTLFFSADDGKNWKAVPLQWKGRAVKVALASSALVSRASGGIVGGIGTTAASFDPNTAAVRARYQAAGSTLAGKVTDPSGAVISSADVVVTRKETSDSRTVKTDNAGGYVITNLAPGNYQIAARAPGFQEQVSTVNVAASEPRIANFTLQVGSSSQNVTVTAEASSIPLAESSVSTKKIAGPSPTNPPLPIFEMTTEDGEHWTSVDGQTWKRK